MPTVVLKNPPAGLPKQIQVSDDAKVGGEGAVYFSVDGKFAVKIYHRPRPEKEQLLQYVMRLFSKLPPEQERFILPPLALIESVDGQRRVGFVMRRVPPNYQELVRFKPRLRSGTIQARQNLVALLESCSQHRQRYCRLARQRLCSQ